MGTHQRCFRESYYGGITEVYKPSLKEGWAYDVNSLYPYAMTKPMPLGKPIFTDEKNLDKIFGNCYAMIQAPEGLNMPILPTRDQFGNLICPIGNWSGWYFSEELKEAKKHGYKIEILYSYHFEDKGFIFKDFVEILYKKKSENSGVKRLIYKLLLNSLYGRFGLKLDSTFTEIIPSSEVDKYYSLYEVLDSYPIDLDYEFIKYRINVNSLDVQNEKYIKEATTLALSLDNQFKDSIHSIAIASAITSYSRIHMIQYKTIPGNPMYSTDTDSGFFEKPLPDHMVGPNLGQMKLEYKFKDAFFLAPKLYGFIKENGDPVVKAKGVGKFPYEKIKALYYESKPITVFNSEDIWLKDLNEFKIKIESRDIQITGKFVKREKIFNAEGLWVVTRPLVMKDGVVVTPVILILYTFMMNHTILNNFKIFHGLQYTNSHFNSNLNSNLNSNSNFNLNSNTNPTPSCLYSTLPDRRISINPTNPYSNIHIESTNFLLPPDGHYLNSVLKIICDDKLTLGTRQLRIEEFVSNFYYKHFIETIKENPDNLKYNEVMYKLIQDYYPKFIKLINVFLKSNEFKKRKKAAILKELDVETIASRCFVIILSNIVANKVSFASLSIDIGESLRIVEARKRIKDKNAFNKEIQVILEDKEISLNIGEVLINIFMETTGLLKKELNHIDINLTQVDVCASRDLINLAIQFGFVKDLPLPMIVQPIPWQFPENNHEEINGVDINQGMYLLNSGWGDTTKHFSLIKKSKDNYGKTKVSPPFVEQINRLASVPLKINIKVLIEIESMLKNKSNLLLHEVHELTGKEGLKPEQLKLVQAHNSKFAQQMQTINIARTFACLNEFYLPVNADWRGRIYTIPSYLTYQGTDLAKSLIEFARPCEMTSESLVHLKRYGANMAGNDKMPLTERIRWVDEHIQEIIKVDHKVIETKPEPFCFLAFSLEMRKWINKVEASYSFRYNKEKASPTSKKKIIKFELIENKAELNTQFHLPIYLDATCNGNQHLAALGRDFNVAYLVNMTESSATDKPQDIYSYVIPSIEEQLKAIAESNQEHDVLKNIKFTRAMVKKSIMTIPYSITAYGIADYLEEFFKIEKINGKTLYIAENGVALTRKNIFVMAHIIHKTFFNLFPNIKALVSSLKELVKLSNSLGISLNWSTPSGLNIEENYKEFKPIKIKCSYRNKRYQVTLNKATAEINKNKQRSAFLPNLVHSLDSAVLLVMTDKFNKACKKLKLNPNLVTVHDCFATSVANVDLMDRLVKESFVEIYNKDEFLIKLFENINLRALETYINQSGKSIETVTEDEIEIKIPNLPKIGKFNIKEVLKSKYFIN